LERISLQPPTIKLIFLVSTSKYLNHHFIKRFIYIPKKETSKMLPCETKLSMLEYIW
jgi:hypothetical protein